MNEEFSQREYLKDDSVILDEANYLINSMWENTVDLDGLPLGSDLSHAAWSEDLDQRKKDFARVLFKNARDSGGVEGFRSARTLNRLFKLLNEDKKQEIYRELMTTPEAIFELVSAKEKEVESALDKKEKIKSKIKKFLDRFFLRDDDFDQRIK